MTTTLGASLPEHLDCIGKRRLEAGVIPDKNPIQSELVRVADFDGLVDGRPHAPLLVLIVRGRGNPSMASELHLGEPERFAR